MPLAPLAERPLAPPWIPFALLCAAVAAAYANALGTSFQLDDWNVIVNEPRVATLSAWWASMPGIRPLLKLSYAANHAFGSGPASFHVVNVAIHAANACLAFVLLERLALRERWDARSSRAAALLGAALFALHPLATEAVTYVSGRSSSLAGLFSLASIVVWIEGRARARPGASILSAALFAAALGVKETAVVVPLALLLWEIGNPRTDPERRLALPTLHFVVLGLAACAALAGATYRHLLATSLGVRGIGTNLLSQAHAIVYLATRLVRLDGLNADPALPVIDAWSARVGVEAVAIVALLALGIGLARRAPGPAFGILWFFLFLAPTSSLLPRLDVANERQTYLALLGPAWLSAWAVGTLAKERRTRIVLVVALLLALPLAIATRARNRVYADEIVFWQDVARKSPWNGRAFNNLGYAYALAARDGEAEVAFRHALALDPEDTRAAVNLRLLREGALVSKTPPR